MKSLNLTLTLKGFGLRFPPSSFSSRGKSIVIRSINFQDFNQDQNQTRNRCLRVSGGMSNNESKKLEEEQSTEKVNLDNSVPEPTPPEKPLPGDCCGSGCVRCVWDVYYEELEDYNNQLQTLSQSQSKT